MPKPKKLTPTQHAAVYEVRTGYRKDRARKVLANAQPYAEYVRPDALRRWLRTRGVKATAATVLRILPTLNEWAGYTVPPFEDKTSKVDAALSALDAKEIEIDAYSASVDEHNTALDAGPKCEDCGGQMIASCAATVCGDCASKRRQAKPVADRRYHFLGWPPLLAPAMRHTVALATLQIIRELFLGRVLPGLFGNRRGLELAAEAEALLSRIAVELER